MKKIALLLSALIMVFALSSCTESANGPGTNQEPSAPTETGGETSGKVLVAYFSATGNTETIAVHIAELTEAELYEIVPETPYTEADLDYTNPDSRSQAENDDPGARPEISGQVENMEDYSAVFLGYPIWNGQAPKIISTFLESYDFSGKTIVPFCTSGSSPIGSSAENLRSLAPGADWLEGMRFSGSSDRDTVSDWISSLGLGLGAAS